MSRIQRHLMWISLVVILTLFGACWMFAAAASETARTHVLTFVPRPTPAPHPCTRGLTRCGATQHVAPMP